MRRYLGVRFITTTLCLASACLLVPARGAQAQTCAQFAETLAQLVDELRGLRAELRDLEVEFSEVKSSSPSNKEKWITDEARRLAAMIEDTRAAAAAAGCGATTSLSTTVNGGAGLLDPTDRLIAGSSGRISPVLALTLAGDRSTLSGVQLLSALTSGGVPGTVTVAGVLSVPCIVTLTVFGSGSGVGQYDSASGHVDLPMTLTAIRTATPATADLFQALVCPAVASLPESLSTTLSTRSGMGRPLNRSTGEIVLSGATMVSGIPLTLFVAGTMSPIFP